MPIAFAGRPPMPRLLLRLLLLAVLAGSWLVTSAPAAGAPLADDPVAVEATLDVSTVRTGDQVHLRVAVTHPPRFTVQFPTAEALQATGLELLASQPAQRARALSGDETEVIEYVLAAFAPGSYPIPPITVTYDTAEGATGTVTAAGELRLTVESVLAGLPNASLRDIRPPVAIPAPAGVYARPAAIAVAAGATALLLLVVVRWLFTRRGRPVLPVAPLAPEEQVRAALRQAADIAAGPRPDYAAFYSLVSGAVRSYLEARTGLPAMASTTRELRRTMERTGTDRWQARIILGLLDECDAVKWAHYAPDSARAQRALTMAYEVVDLVAGPAETAPALKPAAVPTGAR